MGTNAKTAGAIQHVISQLLIKGLITQNDSDHLKREIGYGRIQGFRHLAELCQAYGFINTHNANQIINYGKRFGAI